MYKKLPNFEYGLIKIKIKIKRGDKNMKVFNYFFSVYFLRKGLSLLEMMVAISIILIFFVISVGSFMFFYYNFPIEGKYKETSIFRTVYFELSRAIREANTVKQIYNTYPNKAIYLTVDSYLYAYKLDTNTKKLYKSVDGGYTFYPLPNTYNIKDITFKYKSSIVYVYFYTEFNNIKKEHAFLAKIRKEKKTYFIISGIYTTTNLIQYTISNSENSFPNFTNLNASNTNNAFNIDTKLGSYNIVFSKTGISTSYYYLFKSYKNTFASNWNYKDLDNTNSFSYSVPSTVDSLGSRTKILSVGNYLYTSYVNTNEFLYDPSDGKFKRYSVLYFAYRKLDNSYKGNWIKKEVFRFSYDYVISGNTYNMVIRYPRVAYGLAASNRFFIVFTTERIGGSNININSVNDMYLAYSSDGINWNVVNLDKKLMGTTENNLYPRVPILLIGNIANTINTLHFIFYNDTNSSTYAEDICYFSTNDLINFSTIQSLNDQAYYNNSQSSITINTFRDMDAYFYNSSINIVVSIRGQANPAWNGNRDKLVYLRKSTFNNTTNFNFYPTGNDNNIFRNCSIVLTPKTYSTDNSGEVHIVGYSSTDGRIIYLRNTFTNSLSTTTTFTPFINLLTTNIFSFLDVTYSIPNTIANTVYIHVLGYNSSLSDLDYFRITSDFGGASFSRINNNTIDDNINLSSSSVDNGKIFTEDKNNGYIPGIAVDSNNNLHMITYDLTDSSLGEVIYLNANGSLTNTNRFDTLLIDDGFPYFKSINYDKDNFNEIVSYYDYDTSTTPVLPPTGNLADLKLNINGLITRIDGHRRFDTDTINTDMFNTPGAYPCGFYNDAKLVNNYIYVAYSERQQTATGNLRLKLAISKDLGQTWEYQYTDTSTSNHARNINLEITNNRIYIIHTTNTNVLRITYKNFGSLLWNTIDIPTILANYLRTFKDKNNNIHILAINSSTNTTTSTNTANYIFYNTSSNSYNSENLNALYLLHGITGFGNSGDIKVDDNLNIYIVIKTKVLLTDGNNLLIKRGNTWKPPIGLPNNNTPINSFRIDIGSF